MLQEQLKTVRTTLYITENNKKWLEAQPRGHKTRIVNEAIQRLQNEQIRQEKKQRLLHTLDNLPLYAINGISPKTILQAERDTQAGA